jgi:hypothetical protein
MMARPPHPETPVRPGFLARLLRDPAGNALAIVAAALFPLLAMIGGGVDIGRAYISQSRLQQACDAGVLAARKRLGTEIAVSGEIPDEAAEAGARFFNLNFRNHAYGTDGRMFEMVLEEDYAVSGRATVQVPTTIMAIFGHGDMPVEVTCEAQLNMANTDIMMVLDVTGSMAETNPGDSQTRMEAMKSTVRNFHAQLTAASPAATRLRFGFVPYSTNVNVGHLLADARVNTDWQYQSRELVVELGPLTTRTYDRNWAYRSGSVGSVTIIDSYPATYHAGSPGYTYVDANERVVTVPPTSPSYTCDRPNPSGSFTRTDRKTGSSTEPFAGPPSGVRTIDYMERTEDGLAYSTARSGSTCNVRSQTYNMYVRTFERVTDPHQTSVSKWRYAQLARDVSNWRAESNGCIEERATYEIGDYTNVDLTRALDLNIDLVPSSAATRWSPSYQNIIHARSMRYNGTGSFTKAQKVTNDDYVNPNVIGLAACPAAARKLTPMSASELDAYLATLQPTGATYHDIGMIWGGRLISPTGLFAAENADVSRTRPSTRHLIFLTDGETAPRDLSYSSYGMEPLDERRWRTGSPMSLTQHVENRFAVACAEVKKRNVSVWVISFGTAANPVMEACSGSDRYFVADDADELEETFATIAKRMGELRVTR